MLFNSLEFLLFLPAAFCLYWLGFAGRRRAQNSLLLAASYLFYGWWDWRFLGLIVASSVIDFAVGLRLADARRPASRRTLLALSLSANLGCLGFFKYFDFFGESFAEAMARIGWTVDALTLDIVLPVGISFYTFQTLSYTLDIYRRRLEPTRDAVAFFAFVAFFPQLVAGPIERAAALLPQFEEERRLRLDQAKDGLRQALWGMFKKVVVADSCALGADAVFGDIDGSSSPRLALGLLFFSFQIYGDFSGYSDIAIGTARLFGFRLTQNFATPYFARSIGEFWQRWHISLSSWFRDYVYIPLGGNRGTLVRRITNLLLTFAVSGLWHGASWTFVIWGVLNGLYYVPSVLLEHHRGHRRAVPRDAGAMDVPRILVVFAATMVAWAFFRAQSVDEALHYLGRLCTAGGSLSPNYSDVLRCGWIVVLLAVDWRSRAAPHALQLSTVPTPIRWLVYYALLLVISLYFGRDVPFIYFQF